MPLPWQVLKFGMKNSYDHFYVDTHVSGAPASQLAKKNQPQRASLNFDHPGPSMKTGGRFVKMLFMVKTIGGHGVSKPIFISGTNSRKSISRTLRYKADD